LEGSWLGVKKVDNPKEFGIAVIHKNNLIKSLVEKPKIPVSNEALVGIYKISEVSLLLECIEDLFFQKRITNNEYHLTDALMKMIEKGVSVRSFDALLAANAILLNYPENQSDIEVCYDGNIIMQPVRIGKNCRIKNSIIGPNVAVGENTAIDSCIIKESIVGSYSELRNVVMYQSIIGSDAKIIGICQSLNIGDNTEINLAN
jgi:glucose-1-phosphate thymidylyltransferase